MLVETILLDCDNTLALSEEPAFVACCGVVNSILTEKGVARQFTPDSLMHEFVGQTFTRIMQNLAAAHSFTLTDDQLPGLAQRELDAVCDRLAQGVEACDGVEPVLAYLDGRYQVACVSSSHIRRVRLCLKMTGQQRYIRHNQVFSATSSLPKPDPKPSPAIIRYSLNELGAAAERSVSVEDSSSGVEASVAYGVFCIGYVGSYPVCKQGAAAKKLRDKGARHIMYHWDEFIPYLTELQNSDC